MAQITIHDPYRQTTMRVSEKAFKLIYEPLGYTRLAPDAPPAQEAESGEKVEAEGGDKDTAPAEQQDISAGGAPAASDEDSGRDGAKRRGRRKAADQAGA